MQGDPTDGIRTVFLNLGRLARKIEQDLQYILVVSDKEKGNGSGIDLQTPPFFSFKFPRGPIQHRRPRVSFFSLLIYI